MSFARTRRGRQTVVSGPSAGGGRIVFHADDFGMNCAVTDGIVRGFQHGLITSTALLANAPDAGRAIREWQRLQTTVEAGRLPSAAVRRDLREPDAPLELGVHLNLTQGRPLTCNYPSELLDARGCFPGIGRLFAALYRRRRPYETALLAELAAQVEFLRDHGQRPTHLNGHQYIELLPGLRPAIRELLERHQIPALRLAREQGLWRSTVLHEFRPANWCVARVKRYYADRLADAANGWEVALPQVYFGTSHAGRINLEIMRGFLRSAGRCPLIEVGVHPATDAVRQFGMVAEGPASPLESPGAQDPDGWNDPLAQMRPQELGLLTSPLLVELLQRFGLSLGRLSPSHALPAAQAA